MTVGQNYQAWHMSYSPEPQPLGDTRESKRDASGPGDRYKSDFSLQPTKSAVVGYMSRYNIQTPVHIYVWILRVVVHLGKLGGLSTRRSVSIRHNTPLSEGNTIPCVARTMCCSLKRRDKIHNSATTLWCQLTADPRRTERQIYREQIRGATFTKSGCVDNCRPDVE